MKKNLYFIIGIFFTLTLIAGGTYAYWTWNSSENKNIVFNTSSAELNDYIIYDEGESKFVGDFQISSSYQDGIHSTISIRKTDEAASSNLYASIYMTIDEIGDVMKSTDALKWVITSGDSDVTDPVVLNSGNFNGREALDVIPLFGTFAVTTEEQKFTVWLWIDELEEPSMELTGETIDVNIWTQIDQVTSDNFTITSKNVNYQEIEATVVNTTSKITNYAVTTSNTQPTSWESVSSEELDYVYKLNYTASNTGTYYIWFKDEVGNIVSDSVTVSGIDTSGPVCTWGSFNPESVPDGENSSVTLTCIDNEGNINNKMLTSSDISISSSVGVLSTTVSKQVTNKGYIYTFIVTGTETDGTVTLTLPANKMTDKYGNANTIATSGSLTIQNEVTVTLDPNGGSVTPTSLVLIPGQTYGTLPTPTRIGYTFNGWYTASSGGSQVTSSTVITNKQAHTLYAQWSANTYTISFNGNGSTSGTTASVSCTYNSNCTLTSNGFSKTGYTFAGWATSSTGDVTYTDGQNVSNLATSGTVTLYAVWEVNTYTIAFDGNGSTSGSTSSVSCTYDVSCTLTSNGFSKTGYTFAGWATSSTGDVVYTNGQSVSNLATSGTVTLYAIWEAKPIYTYYNVNGGTISASAGGYTWTTDDSGFIYRNSSLEYTSIALNASSDFNNYNNTSWINITKTGHIAVSGGEWNTSADGTGTSFNHNTEYSYSDLVGYATENDTYYRLNLYVNWTPATYTITYHSNNLLYGLNDVGETYASGNNGTFIYSISNGVITATGDVSDSYGFTTGRVYLETGKTYYFNGSVSGTYMSDQEIYFMLDGGYSNYLRIPCLSGCAITAPATGTYWMRLDINDAGETHTFSNLSIHEVQTVEKTFGGTLGTLPTITRPGYTFNGWYTATSGGTQISSSTSVPSSNTTYYAQWSANTYTVSFNGNGNTSGSTASITCKYGVGCTLTSNGFSKTGYTFAGWATSSTGDVVYTNGQSVSNLATSGTVTLYAKWTANTYKVAFNPTGGSVSTVSKTVTYGSTYGTLPTPTRTGYTFLGWYSDSVSKYDSSKTYKTNPLYYYADRYSDIFDAFAYNEPSLYNHYLSNGKSEGRRISEYNSTDVVNITSNITLYAGWIDATPPTCSISVNSTSWATSATLTVTGNDTSGLLSSSYPYSWTSSTSGFGTTATKTVTENGTYTAYVLDAVGNVGSCSIKVSNIDATGPSFTLSASKSGSTITVSLSSISDAGSGVATTNPYGYYVGTSSTCTYTSSSNTSYTYIASAAGTYYVCAKVTDALGNVTEKKYSSTFSIASGSAQLSAANIYGGSWRGTSSTNFSTYYDYIVLQGASSKNLLIGTDGSKYHVVKFGITFPYATTSATFSYYDAKGGCSQSLYYKVSATDNTNYLYNYPTSSYWSKYDGSWSINGSSYNKYTFTFKPPSGSSVFNANQEYYLYIWGGATCTAYLRFYYGTSSSSYPIIINYNYLS